MEKEKNDDELVFEGEYLNGKRWNGKGKEHHMNSLLEFEGKYLNGKRWNGKVKKYNYIGKLKFEEEYLNGKTTGKIKAYDYYSNGILRYEMEYLG